jgi:hypothetical protein
MDVYVDDARKEIATGYIHDLVRVRGGQISPDRSDGLAPDPYIGSPYTPTGHHDATR